MNSLMNIGVISVAMATLLLAKGPHTQGKFADIYQQPQDMTQDQSRMINNIQTRLSQLQGHYDMRAADEVATFMQQYNLNNYSQEELLANLSTTLQNFYVSDLNESVKSDVVYLYELERFAKDIYQKSYDEWGLELFNTLTSTQSLNNSIIAILLDNYNITYNVTPEAGVYTDDTIQGFYDTYVQETNTTIKDSLSMGVALEEKLVSEIDTLMQNRSLSDDVKIVYEIVKRSTREHIHSFNIALGQDDTNTSRPRGHHMDNGNAVLLKNAQLTAAVVKEGWTIMSIPVTTQTDITSLLPVEANNSIVWSYDMTTGWKHTILSVDENGTLIQSGSLSVAPFEGFWIYTTNEFNISTYVPTDVQTADVNASFTPPSIPDGF